MTLILMGFKGAGKTFLGKRSSHKLHCPYLDTDDLFKTPTLYREVGEKRFRALEEQAILNIPSSFEGIISLGGGAILSSKTQHHVQQLGTLVYLKASFETVRSRITTLPAFASSFEELHTLYLQREPLYAALSTVTLLVDQLDTQTLLNTLTHLYTHGL